MLQALASRNRPFTYSFERYLTKDVIKCKTPLKGTLRFVIALVGGLPVAESHGNGCEQVPGPFVRTGSAFHLQVGRLGRVGWAPRLTTS
jgi:hypothetical protein